ncbi:hypothetical protein [Streptomyces sp. CT34]|nr:hypothetical protein [Streptomyces sp. CT34]
MNLAARAKSNNGLIDIPFGMLFWDDSCFPEGWPYDIGEDIARSHA